MVEPVIDDSLVLWMNGACGKNSPATRKWVDLSGKGNHGELQNFGFGEGSGWTGEGLQFDGVDDYVSLGTVLRSMPTTEMTVGAIWKYTPTYEDGLIVPDEGDIFGSYNDASRPFGLFIKISSGRRLNIGGSISRGYIYYTNWLPEDFNFTVYHSSVLTYIKGISSAFYIDGTYIAPLNVLPDIIIPTAKDIRFGCNLPDRAYAVFKGNIALAYIYNRALSPEEVLQNHQAGYTWTPQIGHRTVTSVVKPITASASRAGRGRRDVISTVKPITGSAERKGVGRREVISTVKPITAKATRKGVGKREVVSTVRPIVSTVNLKLPPIKAVLSLEERVPSLGITERRAEMRITERKPKIEIK